VNGSPKATADRLAWLTLVLGKQARFSGCTDVVLDEAREERGVDL
jgi:hypothetical protein